MCFFFILFLTGVLIQALVQIRGLQDRCVANEGVIRQNHKHQEIENNKWEQYKEAIHILNKELMTTLAKLKEETRLREEVEKVKADLATELTTLRG